MTDPAGGFYSSLDADSEGHEGKFYVWTADELDRLLGEDAATARAYWGVTPAGNFEGKNILHVPHEPSVVARRLGMGEAELAERVERARRTLYDARARRAWPGRDEKVLAGWNGLALRGVSEAARAFGRAEDRALALANGEFLRREMVRQEGGTLRVMRSWMRGEARIPGFLEDHAAVALGLLDLYALTFDERWYDAARRLGDSMVAVFWDDATGQFYDTPADHEALITRPRDVTDNAIPSGTSLAVELLLRLAELSRDAEPARRAAWVLESLAEPMTRYPSAFAHLLLAADMHVHGAVELALVGDPQSGDFGALATAAASVYVPSLVLAGGRPGVSEGVGLLADRNTLALQATAYVCRQYLCDAPTRDAAALPQQLVHAARTPLGVGA